MKIKIGSPATGDNFFPRQRLREKIIRALRRDHIAFLGPRRTGKTSILREIEKNPPPGVSALYLDLQGLRNVPAWLHLMLEATKNVLQTPPEKLGWIKQTGKSIATVLKRIDEITVLGNGIKLTAGQPAIDSWEPTANEFLSLLKDQQLPIYFMLDEFPWFLGHVAANHTAAEVDATLNWFRRVRLELGDFPSRFLVTGSIGLTGLLRRLGLSPAANDFDTIEIEPLTDIEALQFVEKLAEGEGITLTAAARERMLARLGVGWPQLLSTFVSEVQERGPEAGPSVNEIDTLYEEQMVRGSRNKYCQEMYTRLSKPELFPPSERRLAQEILRLLCHADHPFRSEELEAIHAKLVPDLALRTLVATELDIVIETLTHDGYLHRQKDGRVAFASHILRDYWRHRTA